MGGHQKEKLRFRPKALRPETLNGKSRAQWGRNRNSSKGSILVVKPGEKIPTDGVIIDGMPLTRK